MYGLSRALQFGLQGYQQQEDRQARIREAENRRARREVLEGREDEVYGRKVDLYEVEDTLNQQSIALGEQNVESVTRSNDFEEETYGLRLADEKDLLTHGKTDRRLDRGAKRQGLALGREQIESAKRQNDYDERTYLPQIADEWERLRHAAETRKFEHRQAERDDDADERTHALRIGDEQDKLRNAAGDRRTERGLQEDLLAQRKEQAAERALFKDGYTLEKEQDLKRRLAKRQWATAQYDTRQAAQMINEDMTNDVTNAHDIRIVTRDGKEWYEVIDINEDVVIDGDDGPMVWDKAEVDKAFGGNDDKGANFQLDGKSGVMWNKKDGSHKKVFTPPKSNATTPLERRIKDGTGLLLGYYKGSYNSQTQKWSIPDSNAEEAAEAVALYQNWQQANPDVTHGAMADFVYKKMKGLPTEDDAYVDPGWTGDKQKAAAQTEANYQGPRDELANRAGLPTDDTVTDVMTPAPKASAGAVDLSLIPKSTLDKMPVDKVVRPRTGELAGRLIVKRANGSVEFAE